MFDVRTTVGIPLYLLKYTNEPPLSTHILYTFTIIAYFLFRLAFCTPLCYIE